MTRLAVLLASTALALLAPGVTATTKFQADPIIDVIDIEPVLARHDIGNALGLAFDPRLQVFYLGHGSGSQGAFIYTLDAEGALLNEFDLEAAYQPGVILESLSFDLTSGHLFVLAAVPAGQGFVGHLLEIDPLTFSLLDDRLISTFGSIHVRADGIWQALFAEDVIRHYSRALAFIEDVSVAGSFPGYTGPIALTSSFRGGFFVVDHFERRLVEVDTAGRELAEASTAMLGDGRGLAIATDLTTRRIFLQVNNQSIFVLSDEFIGRSPTVVAIDIKPGSFPNSINPRSKGMIPVAILTTATFDATTVDPMSVRFGPAAALEGHGRGHLEDVNADGLLDMSLHFRVQDAGLVCGLISAALTGTTFDGEPFRGEDSVRTVACD